METDRNYGRFFLLLKKMPGADKETIVSQYTCGRTTHLHETTPQEYETMCRGMERITGDDDRKKAYVDHRKKMRSVCLHLMQRFGVDTTDWVRVNSFCENPRIAGKEFRRLTAEELITLEKKLRAIERNGGLKTRKAEAKPVSPQIVTVYINNSNMGQA